VRQPSEVRDIVQSGDALASALLRSASEGFRYAASSRVLDSEALARPYLALRPRLRTLAPTRSTALAIEGFPRSANTFAVAAVRFANGDIPMSHHLHSTWAVNHAVRLGVPTIVLVRHPRDAVVSLVQRHSGISLREGLRAYARFYSRVWESRHGFVAARFETATQNFGDVIDRLNSRFDAGLLPYVHTPSNDAECFRMVEEMELLDSGQSSIREAMVARPSSARRGEAERVAGSLDHPRQRTALAWALEEWQRYAEICV